MEHLPQVRPVLDTVDDVLKYLILSPGAVVSAKEPVLQRIAFSRPLSFSASFPVLRFGKEPYSTLRRSFECRTYVFILEPVA